MGDVEPTAVGAGLFWVLPRLSAGARFRVLNSSSAGLRAAPVLGPALSVA
jgi:hypothetical protein